MRLAVPRREPRVRRSGAWPLRLRALPDVTEASIVSADDLTRVYGEGEAAVDALDGVTVDFPAGRFTADHGPLGLRQVDAHAPPRRPRPPDRRARSCSTASSSPALDDDGADRAAPRQGRLHLPVLQPAAGPRRAGEHPPAAVDRRPQARRGVGRPAHRHRRPARPPRPTARRALRRPAAARRGRARAGHRGPPSSSPTSRPATSTRTPRPRSSSCCAARSTSSARRSSWSPTTPEAAAYADRLIVLRDGQIVDDGESPTPDGSSTSKAAG